MVAAVKPAQAAAGPRPVAYEQPLSERIRTFLRLEALLDQAHHHAVNPHLWDSRAALTTLLEIQSLLGKGDIRAEVLKEMERQSLALARLRNRADVDGARLDNILDSLEKMRKRLDAQGQLGRELRDSEFLASLKNRSSIPGGTCGFDLPGLQSWLHQSADRRVQDLETWLETLNPLTRGLRLVLMLIRESTTPRRETAPAGMFHMNLDGGMSCQMIRVLVSPEDKVFPEISGGKHRCVIRFMERSDISQRPQQTALDINFQLICCQF